MSIPFTQYLLPKGKRQAIEISRPKEIEEMAIQFIDSGGKFEIEMLRDMRTISLTAVHKVNNEPQDIAIRLCPNGPAVPEAVDNLVQAAIRWLKDKSDQPL